MIRFISQDQEVAVGDAAADTTVLEYLRDALARTGTKEGCASGDCGACTVVTVSASGGRLRYEPVNACIAPLGSLHGKALISVEDLQDGEDLHPVQQAMVDAHASQCGFCTPGFVMSLFAAYHAADPAPDRHGIAEALGGNLCRCTGYRPIFDAAKTALTQREPDQFDRAAPALLSRLEALSDDSDAHNTSSGAYLLPKSAEDVVVALKDHPKARLVAGGTDLMLEVTQQLRPLLCLIDISQVSDLQAIDVSDTQIRYGAAVTHTACLESFLSDYPECEELIQRFGSLQIRSRGTIAGNVANASPIGDWPPILLALRGQIEIMGQSGKRVVNADEFFLDYRKTLLSEGEFISAVIFPRRPASLFLRAYKISKRFEDDISSVCAVFAATMEANCIEDIRIGCGGVAATPKRAHHGEQALIGVDMHEADMSTLSKAFDQDFSPISDARASAAFRRQVLKNLLLRCQAEFRGEPTRVHA